MVAARRHAQLDGLPGAVVAVVCSRRTQRVCYGAAESNLVPQRSSPASCTSGPIAPAAMTAAAGTLVDQFAHTQQGQDLLVTVVDDKVHAQRFVVAREVSTGRERRFGVAPGATADDVRSLLPAHDTTIPSEEDVAAVRELGSS